MLDSKEALREYICSHFCCAAITEFYFLTLTFFSYKMVLYVYVFGSCMVHGIFDQGDTVLAI